MNLMKIIKIADGVLLTPDINTDIEIRGGYGADLMSDVLAFSQPECVLLTGLTNPQVVRTAQMADFRAIVFIRGKKPQAETLSLALQEGIPLISSPYGMFELSARLHKAGLPSFESNGVS
ncbi:MAG: transcriptional regulator [Chloroflexi bacterium]|nr:transcriptional regulator [Chloroflexota bacterium]MCA2002524.1 transcriptional regulator [Chloroflexota bacterium]